MSADNLWRAVGFFGQAMFFSRFLVQWIASERLGRSVVPRAFWWFSIAGGAILFAYAALGIRDIVFSLGQGAGLVIYARNIVLLRRSKVQPTPDDLPAQSTK